jgi:hypothetical protein
LIHFFNDKYPSTKSVVNATGSAVDMRRIQNISRWWLAGTEGEQVVERLG